MKFLLLMLCLLTACGPRHGSSDTTTPLDLVQGRLEKYKSLAPRGWDAAGGCDSLLFVSLQQIGLGEMGPVEEAQSGPGHWFRLPLLAQDSSRCDSDISRDMLTGLLTWAWHFKRLDVLENLWAYGSDHAWVMGEERKDGENRVVLTPAFIGLLADLIYHLGGTDHPERLIPAIYSTAPGFVSHLTLLQIYLLGEMNGSLDAGEFQALQDIRKHMSLSPLVHLLIHRYSDGDQSDAEHLLLTLWPADRLPTEADWSEEWRLQRSDNDSGLQPGSGQEPHSGGDFLFPARLLIEWSHAS